MGADVVSAIFDAVTEVISNLGGALVDAVEVLFVIPGTPAQGENPAVPAQLTTLAIVVLTFTGISIGFTIISWVLNLVNLK